MPHVTPVSPKAALITGGGRRIGRAIALALAAAGYAVVLHANRSRAEAEKLAGDIAGQGGRAHVVAGDLADAAGVAGIVPAAAAFGPLSLLVNCASVVRAGRHRDADADAFRAHHGRQSRRAPVPGAGLRRASARGRLDRQCARPARAQADAALPLLHLEQERAPRRDHHPGAGAGTTHPRQRGGARTDAAEPASVGGRVRGASGHLAAWCAGRSPRTSPPRWSIWRARQASPASPFRSTAASTSPGARPTVMSRSRL